MNKNYISDEIAIVGIASLNPKAIDKNAFWQYLINGKSDFSPLSVSRYWDTDVIVKERLKKWHGTFFDSIQFDFKRFGIPPIFRKSISQMSLMLLHVVDACLMDAGYKDSQQLRDDVDVICGTCFGFDSTFNNALKVEGVELAYNISQQANDSDKLFDTLRDRLVNEFGASSHDRVGEMASSIPARIASVFSFRGSVQVVESADATGYVVLESAITSLIDGHNRAVIVATGQKIESMLLPLSLKTKGFEGALSGHPFSINSNGVPIGEGATALLLKRLSDAQNDNDRIYGVLKGLSGVRRDVVSGLKYSADRDAKKQAMMNACDEANIKPSEQQYIDCVLSGIGNEAQATLDMIQNNCNVSKESPLYLGSSVSSYGHTFANSVLTAVASVSLCLHNKTITPLVRNNSDLIQLDQGVEYCIKKMNWEVKNKSNRIAGICGSSLNGVNWHIIVCSTEKFKLQNKNKNSYSKNNKTKREPIAVVGMGGAFGPSKNCKTFWENLLAENDAVQKLPESVLKREVFYSDNGYKCLMSYAQYGSDLKHKNFNTKSHKIIPKRAKSMDIAQKLALSVASEALEDFGLDNKRKKLGKAGVFIASNLSLGEERKLVCKIHYRELLNIFSDINLGEKFDNLMLKEQQDLDFINQFHFDGYMASGIATLISNSFKLNAMPIAVEAACASSLAALKNAVQALRQGRYDIVISGGVELPVNVRDLILCSTQMMLSQEKISPFSKDADGFSPGDGAAMFVLKRLSDAKKDGDKIHAIINSVSGSCDATSMTAPDAEGQALSIKRAYKQVNYSPDSVQYLEAHGTGTRLGDHSEITAITNIYGGGKRISPLEIGSVKSNIGHTFSAAGSAGLLKTLLAMKYETIPATLLRRQIDPNLDLSKIPAVITNKNTGWPELDGRRRAAVSSFGTGGINYHLLLESIGTEKN